MKIQQLAELITQLNSVLNTWLNEQGFQCIAKYDDQFEYDYLNRIISYTLFEDGIDNDLFLEVCKSIYDTDYDLFILSFLHELGHFVTADYINDKDSAEKQIFDAIEEPTNDNKLAYFTSYMEWEATNWACNYIKDNPKTMISLSKSLEDIRVKFFEYIKEEAENENY